MHLGNGMVTTSCMAFGMATLALGVGTAYLLHRSSKFQTPSAPHPMHFALAIAGVFAMQTLNITAIPASSSGHLIGGFLLACWFGPLYALLGISMILGTQSLLFADGGIMTLGLNSVLMGVIPAVIVYPLSKKLTGSFANKPAGQALGSWLSVMLGAFACSLFVLSQSQAQEHAGQLIGSMLGVHALIGCIEALFTVCLIGVVSRIAKRNDTLTVQSTLACLVMASIVVIASFGASPWPDGLDYNLQRLGLDTLPTFQNTIALWPDYNSLVGTLTGNLMLLVVTALVVFVLSPMTPKKAGE
ncbi:MAG: energy-coupling factor ABC transporter permease [Phycisphaeraceae bacterium]|nr:energy-coupling factor ABC transporter permease [Phycisphaeraceae bacterium]